MTNHDTAWADEVITKKTRNGLVNQGVYCFKPANSPSNVDRHMYCLIRQPNAVYKLPKIGRYHVCPICCF